MRNREFTTKVPKDAIRPKPCGGHEEHEATPTSFLPPRGDRVAMTNSRQYCHPEPFGIAQDKLREGSALKRPTTADRRARKKQIVRRCASQNVIATQSRGAGEDGGGGMV